jgi:DNA-binding PadR family transcriptional regulator
MSIPLNATAASLLGLLTRAPLSGWELYAGFECSIGQFWSITRSQVYRELRTLAASGYIEIGATGPRERRICTITPNGRAAFATWIAALPGDELIRFPLLLSVFFGDSVAPQTLAAACRIHRRKHAERLAAYEAQRPDVIAEQPFPALALEFGIAYERTVLDWIDRLPWMTATEPA